MRKKLFFKAVLLACLLPGLSYAQLYKCVGSDGKVTFTQHGCSTDSAAENIDLGTVNSQDSTAARRSIAEEQLKRSMQPQKVRVTVVADPRIAGRQNRARNDLCREANTPYKGAQNRQLTARQRAMSSACGSGASAGEIERVSLEHKKAAAVSRRPTPSGPPAPSHITDCDGAGCWDNQGNRYNHGAGPTHFRQDGRVCHDIGGGQMRCN